MTLAMPERLLALLVQHPDGVPGDAARAALGGDAPAAGAARVLESRGHPLATRGDGWRLACARQHFDPAAFAALAAGSVPALEVWERVGSTNDLGRDGAAHGAPDGALWLAEEQTLGRGRQGRSWHCAAHAGLLASWIVRAPLGPGTCPTLLPLAVGLGACEALAAATGARLAVKWPNDLWLADRKVGGLLVEARHGTAPHAVVGLGLNVHAAALAGAPLSEATTLAAAGSAPPREALLARLLAGAARRVDDWRTGRFAAVRQAWLELDVVVGRRVRCELADGLLEGRARDVSAEGLLAVETADGRVVLVAAGEVHLA
jgi:BirA family biotin operon repressor/biotin-[acetyl-CoA-carboxylase] ligase